MNKYEDLNHLSENRMPQRAYYIPKNSETLLNGIWDFKFYEYIITLYDYLREIHQ